MHLKRQNGFSLTELLVSLLIIGQIAVFTIPKVIQSTRNNQYNAVAKEAIAALSDAYAKLKYERGYTSTTTSAELTPYLNYVKLDTSGTLIDRKPYNSAGSSYTCSASTPCLRLHNGAVLMYSTTYTWSGTTTLDSNPFHVDPTGKYEGFNDSVGLELYYMTGKIATFGTILPNTVTAGGSTFSPNASWDPTWFSW